LNLVHRKVNIIVKVGLEKLKYLAFTVDYRERFKQHFEWMSFLSFVESSQNSFVDPIQ